jgi:hypothetical protein
LQNLLTIGRDLNILVGARQWVDATDARSGKFSRGELLEINLVGCKEVGGCHE